MGAELTSRSLLDFAQGERFLELSVPWANKTIFLVPGAVVAAILVKRGISRGRIWTANEARTFLLTKPTREEAIKVAATNVMFGASLEAVRDAPIDAFPPASSFPDPDQMTLDLT